MMWYVSISSRYYFALYLTTSGDFIQIATNNEIMAAKIARLDYPINKWPGLLSGLMEIIQTSAEKRFSTSSPDEVTLLRLRRALSILNSILKEFNTMKSPAGSQTNTKVIDFLWFCGPGLTDITT